MARQMQQTERREPRGANPHVNLQAAGAEPTVNRPVHVPPADIYETDESIVILLDLPGVQPDDLDVTMEKGVLTVRGSMGADRHEGYRCIYAEYGSADFERAFALSETIDPDRIDAKYTEGVLTLQLPKTESAKLRKIQVQT